MHLVIYKLTSPNGKCYIGQTRDVESRFRSYRTLHKRVHSQRKIYNALKKYGPENFTYEIIQECLNQNELNDAEIHWIEKFDSIANGYNLMTGGSYGTHSEETRRKLSEAHTGKKWSDERRLAYENSEYVFKPSDDHLKKLHSGRDKADPGMKGKSQSDYQKECASKALRGKKKSAEHKMKLSKVKQRFNYVIISPEGTVFETTNLHKFCKEHELSTGNMTQNCLHGKYYKGWSVTRTTL